jgi:hypothetical protein
VENDGRGRQEGPQPAGGDTREAARGAETLSLRPLEKKIVGCAALIVAGAAVLGRYGMLPGAAVGGAVAYGNFLLIRMIIERAFTGGATVNKWFILSYVLKFLALVGLVYGIVRSGRFDVLGFLLGFSSLFLGVLAEGLSRSLKKG